jgi:uncharacterized integral membrane protein
MGRVLDWQGGRPGHGRQVTFKNNQYSKPISGSQPGFDPMHSHGKSNQGRLQAFIWVSLFPALNVVFLRGFSSVIRKPLDFFRLASGISLAPLKNQRLLVRPDVRGARKEQKFMLVILLSVVFGLAIGYFSTQNATPVTLQFGDFTLLDVPLYLVTIGSLLLGLLIAWIFYFARTVSTSVTIFGKDYAMRKSHRTVTEMDQKLHELEAENARLKAEMGPDYPVTAARSYK